MKRIIIYIKNKILKRKWSFRTKNTDYCINEYILLYKNLNKFNELIFTRFNLNINNYPILSCIFLAIFKAHYLIVYQYYLFYII